ncbi:MAG: YegS/Rv2252/BmrU family lipid kinase [Lachnospiraceae bacterium]|nr:YegS/Rv2252/BmrU family lipid kinase [Lachnospiraceae bacterium]CDA68141.1 putative uncharacterized protein [Clostridium sp. CAG:510]
MSKKKMLFIVNPLSGKGKVKERLLGILDIFIKNGYEVTVHVTQKRGDALNKARERDDSYDRIVCSGGDGTLDEVVTGVVQSDRRIEIGYIPAGSTNDFANSLCLPKSMKRSAEVAVKGKVFPCDIGVFNNSVFVYVAAFGMFTEVSYATDQSLKNALGHMAYVLKGVQSLTSVKAYDMRFECDDQIIEGKFIYGMITNSVSVGGFKKLTGKNVELNDGKLEVTLVRQPENLQDMNRIVTALVERNPNNEFIYWFKTSHITIIAKEEIAWTLDGEFGGNHKEVKIEDRREAISMIVP